MPILETIGIKLAGVVLGKGVEVAADLLREKIRENDIRDDERLRMLLARSGLNEAAWAFVAEYQRRDPDGAHALLVRHGAPRILSVRPVQAPDAGGEAPGGVVPDR